MSAPAGRLRDPAASAPPWPRPPLAFVASAAALVLVAAAAGWLGRDAATPERVAPPAPRAIDLGAVSVSAPGTWAPARGPVAGLPDPGPGVTAFAPAAGLRARALLTLAPSTDASLVPERLRPLTGGAAPRPTSLAGLPAWLYQPRELEKGWMAEVTVAPTTAGSFTVACVAHSSTWSAAQGCADRLTGVSLRGATPLEPGPTLAFRRQLAPALERLNARRGELRGRLRGATARRGQARFAARLARVHARALAVLAPRAADGASLRVVRELRRATRGYGRLAAAARNGWPARYRRASGDIRRADRALARAVTRVR